MSEQTTESGIGDAAAGGPWTAWQVAPDSGFEIEVGDGGATGHLELVQVTATEFVVKDGFRFRNERVEADLLRILEREGVDEADARERIARASRFVPVDADGRPKRTDLASVPPFVRWFENTYGLHTLAAILHDELITDEVDGGALGSDTLADRFFRKMLETVGMPWLKRWVMWTAVAARTRWAAAGIRRLLLILWAVAALAGTASVVAAVSWWAFADGLPGAVPLLFSAALVLPAVAAPLWGRQFGASFIAALAGGFVIPAAVIVVAGLGLYRIIEWMAGRARIV